MPDLSEMRNEWLLDHLELDAKAAALEMGHSYERYDEWCENVLKYRAEILRRMGEHNAKPE